MQRASSAKMNQHPAILVAPPVSGERAPRHSRPRLPGALHGVAVRCFLMAFLGLGAAHAADADVQQARAIFNVGAQAYEKGDFAAALEAFEAAYKLAPRPGILFSMAQTHRRQYHVTHQDSYLREALRLYREYLEKAKDGERRGEAAQALVELEPLAARLAPESEGPGAGPERGQRTRLMVSSSAEHATIALDGGKPLGSPLISDVSAGRHRVRTDAPGYVSEEREVTAVEGGLVAIDMVLRERPARLTFSGPPDTDISIDRRLAGRTPLGAPLEVQPGRRKLWLSRGGYEPRSVVVDLGRGEKRRVPFDLEPNRQRVAARVLLFAAGAAAITSGVFTVLAFAEDKLASDIRGETRTSNISPSRMQDYDSARSARDTFRTAAIVSVGAGVGLAATAGALLLFDRPVAPPLTMEREESPGRPEPKKSLDMSFAPAIGPTFLGVSARGTL